MLSSLIYGISYRTPGLTKESALRNADVYCASLDPFAYHGMQVAMPSGNGGVDEEANGEADEKTANGIAPPQVQQPNTAAQHRRHRSQTRAPKYEVGAATDCRENVRGRS